MVGDKTFLMFQPVSNVPTDDNSVTVTFKVTLPQVVKEADYESYITYKLDGVEQQGAISKSTLVSSRGSR